MVYEAINLHHPANNWVTSGRRSGRSRWAGSGGVAPVSPRVQAGRLQGGTNPLGVPGRVPGDGLATRPGWRGWWVRGYGHGTRLTRQGADDGIR